LTQACPTSGPSALAGPSSSRPEELEGSSISLLGDLHPQQSVPRSPLFPPGDHLNLAVSRVRDSSFQPNLGHVRSHRTFFFSARRTRRFFYFPIGKSAPTKSFPEVSPFTTGDQLNLAISRVRDSKLPTLPFKSSDTRSGDTGIAPSTCNRGLGLMLALLATLKSRDLATSRPRRLNRRIFTLLVRESPRCAVPPYTLPRVHKNLGSSALRDSAFTRVSAPRHFTTRVLCATCTPLTLHYGPHCSSCRDIAISRPRDIRAKFSDLFLRGPETRSLAQIQRSSCIPDPTVVLLSPPRDLATWSTQCLGFQPANSRVREISRSLATCPPQMDATILSLLRRLASSRLATLNTQYLGFHPANSRVSEITRSLDTCPSDGRLTASSLPRHSRS
jgi:hypothetical protein